MEICRPYRKAGLTNQSRRRPSASKTEGKGAEMTQMVHVHIIQSTIT